MPGATASNAGNAPIVNLGHTVGTKHGTNPLAKLRGESMAPTPISFGGGKTGASQGTGKVGSQS